MWTFVSVSPVRSSRSDRRFGKRFTELGERPWSTHFVIPEPSASSLSLNMPPTVTCSYRFATTVAESSHKFSTRGVRDTGAWLACESGPRESEGSSESLAAQPPGRRSNCPSQTVLRSNCLLMIHEKSLAERSKLRSEIRHLPPAPEV